MSAKVRVAGDRAVEHQVHHGAGRVEQELEHRPRPPERRVLPADRRRRVDEDAGAAPVELVEHRIPRRVAEVGAVDVGEQDEPVDVEVVDAVRDLGDRGVDVGKRERAEQTEATGMVDDRASAGLVHLAGQVARRGVVGEVDARGRDRQERGGDPEPVHERDVLVGRPLRDLPACRRAGAWPGALAAPAGRARAGSGRGRRACRAPSDHLSGAPGAAEEQRAHRVRVRLDHVVGLGIETGEPAALGREHEHRRARAGEDVVQVRGRDVAGRRRRARGARRAPPCSRRADARGRSTR